MDTPRPVPIDDVLAHRRLVMAPARRFVGDAGRADDVAQDAWVSILRSPPRHQSGLSAWLARLVRHRAGDAWRAQTRRTRLESLAAPAAPATSPTETAAKMDTARRVVEAVAELPEP